MAAGKYKKWLEPDGLLRLEAWARDGLSNEQIAKNVGITTETLRVWGMSYPAISEALKRGKEVVDIEVENAMCKRALGYEYEEAGCTRRWSSNLLAKEQKKTTLDGESS